MCKQVFNIKVSEFCLKYNLVANALGTKKTKEKIKKALYKPEKGVTMVDENFFIRRKKFQERIVSENIDTYYKMNLSDTVIARYLTQYTDKTVRQWQSWLNQSMFMPIPEGILMYKVTTYHWLFNKYMRSKK